MLLRNKSLRFLTVAGMCLIGAPLVTKGQIVGGGNAQPTNNSSQSLSSEVDRNQRWSSFSFVILFPTGKFGQAYSFGNTDFVNMATPFGYVPPGGTSPDLQGQGATTGYAINYTHFFTIHKSPGSGNREKRTGIQFGVEEGYVPLNWDNVSWDSYNMTMSTSGFYYGGFKIGPEYNITAGDEGLGIYFTIDPYLTNSAEADASYDITDANGVAHVGEYDVYDVNNPHISINASLGIVYYYKMLIASVEFNWVHSQYEGQIEQSETIPNFTYNETNFNSVTMNRMLKFSVGIKFGGKKH